jgi:hypothetical protein
LLLRKDALLLSQCEFDAIAPSCFGGVHCCIGFIDESQSDGLRIRAVEPDRQVPDLEPGDANAESIRNKAGFRFDGFRLYLRAQPLGEVNRILRPSIRRYDKEFL